MATLRSQVLLILAVTLGALLTAKTLVDFSRARPRIEDEASAQCRAALLQAGPLVERAYADGALSDVRQTLDRMAALPGVRRVALLRPQGQVLAASETALEGRPAEETALAPAVKVAARMSGGMEIEGETLRASTPVRLDAGAPTPLLTGPPVPPVGSAALVMELDLSERFAAARQAALIENGIGFAIALAMLLLVSILLDFRLGRPIGRIAESIEQFGGGDRGARTGLRGSSEVARVARAFDAMAERLQAEEIDLLDAQVSLDNVLKSLPVGVMVVKRDDGKPYYVNPKWRELFGITMDANRDILSLLSTVRCERPDGAPYPIEQLPIPAVLRTGRPAEARDLCVRRDDHVVRLFAHAVPLGLSRADGFDAVLALVREPDPAPSEESPSAPRRPDAPAVAVPEAAAYPPTVDDRETVLVAEADAEVRVFASHALADAGYRVLVAADGAEAVALFRREGPRVRVVVLDLALRGPEGESLLDELLAADPMACMIAVSGYRPDLPVLAASGKVTAFLPRPFGPERLVKAVQEALDAAEHVTPS